MGFSAGMSHMRLGIEAWVKEVLLLGIKNRINSGICFKMGV